MRCRKPGSRRCDLLRKHKVPIAIATDCNPGTSPLLSPTLAMNMACTLFGLTPEEALAGMTINAARALGLAHEVGSIAAGKAADLCRVAHRKPGRARLLDRPSGAGAAHFRWSRQLSAMTDRRDNSRHIRARRGSEIKAKSWTTEAAVRMLMNNLDDEVAEDPQSLVVYGGIGRAARNWACFDKIVETLERLEEDQTLLVQSGKPVGVFRTHKDAPRVLIANSNLVPKWANWEMFNELDRKGLMMYGQMTAGSWIYIGTQGIVQGTYETFAEMGRQHYGGDLKGKWILTAGPRRNGRRAAARGGDGRRALHRHRGARKAGSRSGSRPATSTVARPASTRRWRSSARRPSRPASACSAMPPRSCPRCSQRGIRPDALTDQTSAHDPANGYCPAGWSVAKWQEMRERDPAAVADAARAVDGRAMSKRCSPSRTWASRPSIMATTSARKPRTRASPTPSTSPASSRPMSGRCSAAASARSAGSRCSGDPEDIYRTDQRVKELIPDDPHLHRWLDMARERIAFQGLPARICWVGLGQRHRLGLAFNEMVRNGEVSRADRHRPRPSRQRQRRLAQPRDREHEGRQRRRSATGRCSTPCSTPRAARPGSRSTTAAASAWAIRSTPAW